MSQGYDAAGRPTTINDWSGNSTSYKYDADSNNCEIDYANGTVATLTFDASDRTMGTIDAKSGIDFINLTYTRADNSALTGAGSNSYGYDALNRVTSANTTTYTYDGADQMTQAQAGAATTTLGYDIANQLQSRVVSGVSTNYSYDQNGNRTRAIDGGNNNTTWSYDQANRLISFQSGAATAGYAYNGDGLLSLESSASSSTALAWNSQGRLPLIVIAGSSYINGPDGLPLEQVSAAGTVCYYHHDQIGNTLALTDASGAVVQSYGYDAYGNKTASSGTIVNPFQFQGQYLDPLSGLYYLRARFYDPLVGAFVTRDPAVATTRAPYAFASDTPLNGADPSGLCWPSWACGAENAVGGAVGGAASWVGAHPTQTAAIAVGAVLIIGAIALTGGVGLAAAASYAAIDTTEVAGALEGVDLAIHLGWVYLVGGALGAVGVGGVIWGATSGYDTQSGSAATRRERTGASCG
ncbi:MAG: RHS repeat-associated core domain-containing protein [Candidatus Dormibacteraceae bacterium]